jgi:hypothetical protein
MFEWSTVFRYFDVRDFVIRVSVNSGIFYSELCRIIKITKVSHNHKNSQVQSMLKRSLKKKKFYNPGFWAFLRVIG